jgi:ADP-dependent NAD(P)H-hydrate dehydratase / NAD(P)H-hydrate epimerase
MAETSSGRVTGIPLFPSRRDDVHKGEVGRLVVVGGRADDHGMVGAPALVANAAFRTGAGLVQIITTQSARAPVSVLAPCATTRLMLSGDEENLGALAEAFGADVLAIGPGLCPRVTGRDIALVMRQFVGGIVVDADGLNALAANGNWWSAGDGRVVVTPHPGEMRRLVVGLQIECDLSDRVSSARVVARETGCVVVLKGAGTVVADGECWYVNTTGHSGMATGGVGDVLTGVIAGLMGQGMGGFEASVLGVYLHGLAGDIAGGRMGMVSVMATDIVDALGEAIGRTGSRRRKRLAR